MQVGSGAVVATGMLTSARRAEAGTTPRDNPEVGKSDFAFLSGKIALEEHFDFSATENPSYAALRLQLQDLGSGRIAEMDRGGVKVCILSLTSPGIQAITNARQAVEVSRQANDHLAEHIAKNPKRLKGFAALPLQDPQAAAQELTRSVKDLGFCGAMVNGFTQTGDAASVVFYDMPQYRDFWATVPATCVVPASNGETSTCSRPAGTF